MTLDSINHMNTSFAFSQIHEVWVEVCSPKRCAGVLTPVPMSVTLFGNGVFADVIRLRWGHTGLRRALRQDDQQLYQKMKIWTQTNILGTRPWKDRGKSWRDAATSLGRSGATRSRKRQGMILCYRLWRSKVLPRFWLWTSGPQNFEGINFCCLKSPRLWCFITEAPGNEEIMYLFISKHFLCVPLSVSTNFSQNRMPRKHLKHQLRAFSSITQASSERLSAASKMGCLQPVPWSLRPGGLFAPPRWNSPYKHWRASALNRALVMPQKVSGGQRSGSMQLFHASCHIQRVSQPVCALTPGNLENTSSFAPSNSSHEDAPRSFVHPKYPWALLWQRAEKTHFKSVCLQSTWKIYLAGSSLDFLSGDHRFSPCGALGESSKTNQDVPFSCPIIMLSNHSLWAADKRKST